MTDKKVWFVTGAGRGMGVDIAQAAFAAGYAVVATGRNTNAVADAVSFGEPSFCWTGSDGTRTRGLPPSRFAGVKVRARDSNAQVTKTGSSNGRPRTSCMSRIARVLNSASQEAR